MKRLISISIILLLFTSILYATDFPEIKGFTPESEVMFYTPENLYEYINGAADAYLAYGFKQLLTRDFAYQNLKFTVDIYDMGSRLNAFGIYKDERPADKQGLKIGVEAVVSPPYQCLLLKGRYYVKVNTFEGEFTPENGKEVLTAIAAALSGTEAYPVELTLLPQKNKIPDSENYTREAFLGYSVLQNCLYAKYKSDGKEFRYFVILPLGENTPDTIWKKLSGQWEKTAVKGKTVLFKKIPYKGFAGVVQTQGKILGVADCENKEQMLKLLLQAAL